MFSSHSLQIQWKWQEPQYWTLWNIIRQWGRLTQKNSACQSGLNHSRVLPPKPTRCCKRANWRLWSIVWRAGVRSNKTRHTLSGWHQTSWISLKKKTAVDSAEDTELFCRFIVFLYCFCVIYLLIVFYMSDFYSRYGTSTVLYKWSWGEFNCTAHFSGRTLVKHTL